MKPLNQRFVVIAFLLVALALSACKSAPIPLKSVPSGSTVAGKTIGEWSTEWWKWTMSHSYPDDPFTDVTGKNANRNQSGPVFFLAFSPGDNFTRSFTVPAQKYILIPVLAGSYSQAELGADKSPDDLRREAKALADQFGGLFVKLDGKDLPNISTYREISPEFTYVGAPNNVFRVEMGGGPVGESGNAVGDGYFVMLEPPEPGSTHRTRFGGAIGDLFKTTNAVTITIGTEK